MSDIKEFLRRNYVEQPGPLATLCWIWIGSSNAGGYGTVNAICYGHNLAHRLSYAAHIGPIPAGLLVLHHCDQPACVRPEHLYCGTAQENNRDMWDRGREYPPPGERALTEEDILKIRELGAQGYSHAIIADRYRVDRKTIGAAVRGQAWKHVGGPITVIDRIGSSQFRGV